VEQLAQSRNHLGRRPYSVGRPYQEVNCAERFLFQAERFAYAALDAIALGRARAVPFRHENPQPRRSGIASLQKKAVSGQIASRPLLQQAFKMRFLP
jgi:hypothetical protein